MSKGPKQVLIIRHGEKVGDPKKDDDGGNDLSIRGSARAAALPSIFVPGQSQFACGLDFDPPSFAGSYQQVPIKGARPPFPVPNSILATQRSKNSHRPVETVTPLAIALNMPLNDRFTNSDADIEEMTKAILNNQSFADEIVLICWHHGKIPAIAKALGISRPPKWDAEIFDRVWQITFAKGKATLADLPQKLLFGDATK
jgi:hypothetical protein